MRIVCFHLNQIGDLLFSLPSLRSMKLWDPECHIISVARPVCKTLLERTSLPDTIIERNNGPVSEKLKLVNRIRRERPDAAILFSQSVECMVMGRLSGAKKRYGITTSGLDWMLTRHVQCSRPPSMSNDLSVLQLMGCPPACDSYVGLISATDDDRKQARSLLEASSMDIKTRKVILAPGTSSRRSVKAWTIDGWAAVIDHFSSRDDTSVIVVGTDDVTEIASRAKGKFTDLTTKTQLNVLMAVLEQADVVVGVDSGILHLAAALRGKVVGLYGMSDPTATGPGGEGHYTISAGVECSPCQLSVCKSENICMTQIHSRTVIEAAESILENTHQRV